MPIRNVFEHVMEVARSLENIEVSDLKQELDAGDDVLLLDIRELQELVDKGTIPGATHVPRGMLEFWASPDSPYARDYFGEHRRTVVFCAGGGRSSAVNRRVANRCSHGVYLLLRFYQCARIHPFDQGGPR